MGEGKLRRALLGALLVLGLLAMHELVVGVEAAAAHATPRAHAALQIPVHGAGMIAHSAPSSATGSPAYSNPGGDHGMPHGFAHLCVFVLATLLGLSLAVLALRPAPAFARVPGRDGPARAGPPPRAPPCTGRALLHLVCVSRT